MVPIGIVIMVPRELFDMITRRRPCYLDKRQANKLVNFRSAMHKMCLKEAGSERLSPKEVVSERLSMN